MSARRSRVIEGARLTQGLRRFARALGVNATMAQTVAALSEGREARRDRIDSYASLVKASELQAAVRRIDSNDKPAEGIARLAASGSPVGRDSHHDSESARARAALAALPLDQRAALMLVVTEGFQYAEAAEAMRLSPQAFVDLLATARAGFAVEIAAPRDRPQLRVVK